MLIKDGAIVYTDSPKSFLSVCEDEEEYQVDNDEVIENLKKILRNSTSKKTELIKLKQIITYLYSNINNIKQILNLIEESEVDETMSTVAERLREEYINKELNGISKGIAQIIKNMLDSGMSEYDILYHTKIDKKQFEKIKKEFKNETK